MGEFNALKFIKHNKHAFINKHIIASNRTINKNNHRFVQKKCTNRNCNKHKMSKFRKHPHRYKHNIRFRQEKEPAEVKEIEENVYKTITPFVVFKRAIDPNVMIKAIAK